LSAQPTPEAPTNVGSPDDAPAAPDGSASTPTDVTDVEGPSAPTGGFVFPAAGPLGPVVSAIIDSIAPTSISLPSGIGRTPTFFNTVLAAVAQNVQTTVKPAAAVSVAATFGFPLILALAVVLYLVVQSRLDSRDPKLRYAPRSAGETYVAFGNEDR
jgi:hypothetical protein